MVSLVEIHNLIGEHIYHANWLYILIIRDHLSFMFFFKFKGLLRDYDPFLTLCLNLSIMIFRTK